jgi:YesN/AraC family two-component response regulator
VEIAVLLSRAGANSDDYREITGINNRYLKRIEDSKTTADVCETICLLTEMMAGKIVSFQGIRHAAALRRAERFIWENYTRKISLKEVAGASGLSAPYFSTVFRDEMGENFSNYLNRIRVEKAAEMLKETELPFSGISAACGFEDHAWFSKIFKNYTGFSPRKYRESGGIVN